MDMKNFAANRLYLSATEYIVGPVVVHLTEEGIVAGFEALTKEYPNVSWLGGIFLLLPVAENIHQSETESTLNYAQANPLYQPLKYNYALWHLDDAPVDAPVDYLATKAIRRLG